MSQLQLCASSEIAIALGKSKRGVQLTLAKIKRIGVKFVRGQECDAYSLTSLPPRYLQELEGIAERRGYRNVEHLLSDPPQRFTPADAKGRAVPLAEISEPHTTRAVRLQEALGSSLTMRDGLTESETRQRVLVDFRRSWGAASEKTWSRLLQRTIQRDAGEERFDDLALYFDAVVTRRPEARERVAIARTPEERTILDYLNAIAKPAEPTLEELALVWAAVCEFIADAATSDGRKTQAVRRLVELLSTSAVRLARSPEALRKQIKRKYERWRKEGETLVALEDRRAKRSGWFRGTDLVASGDRDKIVAEAVLNCEGNIAPAIRSLRAPGHLSSDFVNAYSANAKSKSYVPDRVLKLCAPEVARMQAIHRGPRENKRRQAYHSIDWRNVAAGDFFSADDLTSPVYTYRWLPDGRLSLIRGQLLVVIDERTTCILSFVFVSEPVYNSAQIYGVFTDAFRGFGVPRRGLVLENGLWRRASWIKGRQDADPNGITDRGLRRVVGRIIHAKQPRGKNIERVFGLVQSEMARLPGWSSRDERRIPNERFQTLKRAIESGKENPADHLLSEDQLAEAYSRIFETYNDTPQQGVKLQGLTPRQGWEGLQSTPLVRFDDRSLWLLASNPIERRIDSRGGIIITIPGIGKVRYIGRETGQRAGETVTAWVNPRCPDVLCCTTLDKKEVFTVPRYNPLNDRIDATNFAEEDAKLQAHNRHSVERYRTLRNALPEKNYRPIHVDRWTADTGKEMARQGQQETANQVAAKKFSARLGRRSREAQVSMDVIHRAPETIDYLDEYAAGLAELKQELAKENE